MHFMVNIIKIVLKLLLFTLLAGIVLVIVIFIPVNKLS